MVNGLFISLTGMAVVIVVLAILMFLIMVMGRILRSAEVAMKEVAVEEVVAKERTEPEDTVEVAAIALALACYLREHGKELRPPIAIDGVQYQVEIGNLSTSKIAVSVDGARWWASVCDEELAVTEETTSMPGVPSRDAQRGRGWRSAYPIAQGGYWGRRGWTGRGDDPRVGCF